MAEAMHARTILLKWQRYNLEWGTFDADRTTRQFADLLGVAESYLSHIYSARPRSAAPNLPRATVCTPAAMRARATIGAGGGTRRDGNGLRNRATHRDIRRLPASPRPVDRRWRAPPARPARS